MKRVTVLKRHVAVLAIAGGLIAGWSIARSYAAEPCPLPDTATASEASAANQTDNSPPGPPQQNQGVLHNGFILCLPPSAAEAHIRHGDTPQGPCDKPGRVK